jgi:hypothetical protein
VLDTYVDVPENAGAFQAPLDLDELVAAVRHIKPRLVYLSEGSFELESETEELATDGDDAGDDEDERASSREAIEKLRKKWSKRNGEPCVVVAAIVADGVLLTAISRPAWRDVFDAEFEAIREESSSSEYDDGFALSDRDRAEVREKAVVLAGHPSFNSGRTSFDKRVFLAETLFPDTKPKVLQAITRRAENIDWLNKSGFKP